MQTVLFISGKGGPRSELILNTLENMDISVIISYVRPNTFEERNSMYQLFSQYGRVIEVNSMSSMTQEILDQIREYKIDGVITLSELMIDQAVYIAQSLGLPSTSMECMNNIRNKFKQRSILAEANIPIPKFEKIENSDDLDRAFQNIGCPGVLKPACGTGSFLTFLIESYSDLIKYYNYSVTEINSNPIENSEPIFLYEEKLEGVNWHENNTAYGNYVSVESIIYFGEIHHICVSDRRPLSYPFREGGIILPSALSAEKKEILYKLTEDAIIALNFTHGATHTEIIFTDEGPKIIEINGRLGGPVAELFNRVSNINIIEQTVRVALGLRPKFPKHFDGVASMFNIHGPDRIVKITDIKGIEILDTVPNVFYSRVCKTKNDVVDWRKGTSENILYGRLKADNHSELLDIIQTIENGIEIVYEDIESN